MHSDRYAPDVSFPAYAFVPGRHPHPVTDPQGHSFGRAHGLPETLDPQRPRQSLLFLVAIDLFNAGYYWEAHEAWEGLWIAAGRSGELASFLKGLIKLAAAGVKAREGKAVGVERHARRALELFQLVQVLRPEAQGAYCGFRLEKLILDARLLAESPPVDDSPSIAGRNVFPFQLTMSDLDPLSLQTYTTPV